MNSTPDNAVIRWDENPDGLVILTIDDPAASANTATPEFIAALAAAADRIAAESDRITGVVLRSAKKTFFAGGNLDDLLAVTADTVGAFRQSVRDTKAALRKLETAGVPVVALLNGAALGGGYEIALAAHQRIAVDDPRVVVGLPEVKFGLLPGGGGVVRTVRMLGLRRAIDEVLLDARSFAPRDALAMGLIDDVVAGEDELLPRAKEWIAQHSGAVQPWDRRDYVLPGEPTERVAGELTAKLQKRVHGANLPAYRAILAAAAESTRVAFDAAQEIETRYFLELVVSPVAKNMIKVNFFDLRAVRGGAARPDEPESEPVTRLAVIGAGMMGAALAYVAAANGLTVLLMDVSAEVAEKGKDYARRLAGSAVKAGKTTAADGDALLERIKVVTDDAELAGAEAVIEAVAEDPDVKRELFARIEPHLPGALYASNTSTLPITDLAHGVQQPESFIGMHFFSPVDRMPLLEIIVGEKTTPRTVARAFDLGRQLGKTPIVVNDSRGFFTSRVITARMNEALALLGEGVPAPSLERASLRAGYAVGILQFLDEVTITLPRKVLDEAKAAAAAAGAAWEEHPAESVLYALIDEHGRSGRATGTGLYEYLDGKRQRLWSGLREHFQRDDVDMPMADVTERMLFAEALETVKCFDEGVLSSVEDANVGSLIGIAYPAWTGGVVQFVTNYPGGVDGFVRRANELADQYGPRFRPPASLAANPAYRAA